MLVWRGRANDHAFSRCLTERTAECDLGSGEARVELVPRMTYCLEGAPTVILPKVHDPRFVTIRRGGALTDPDHLRLALWAASCAEHVLDLFEAAQPVLRD